MNQTIIITIGPKYITAYKQIESHNPSKRITMKFSIVLGFTILYPLLIKISA